MNYDELSEFAMEIIANSGMARSCYIEAIKYAKTFDFNKAEDKIKEAESYYSKAHDAQNELIFKEAEGNKFEFNLLLVHAQDHLMMSLMAKENAKEFIDLYKIIKK